jgi:NAD(P)H-flavin reductase
MVATVTGVAPFVSMIRYWAEQPAGNPAFYVLEGASYVDELGYDMELQALAAKHAEIRFVATCSRPQDPRNAAWRGETGRVNAIVERFIRQWNLQPEETCIYACGHPLMIEDVQARYSGSGFVFEQERFWRDKSVGTRRRDLSSRKAGA